MKNKQPDLVSAVHCNCGASIIVKPIDVYNAESYNKYCNYHTLDLKTKDIVQIV